MTGFKADIYGLNELKDYIDTPKMLKRVAPVIGTATLQLHGALKSSVFNSHQHPKSLDSVLVGKSTSTISFGKNVIESGLVYKYKPVDLGKFSPTWEWGNINAARRQGRVHSVVVRRDGRKVVHGKDHRGGFIPKKRNDSTVRKYNYKSQELSKYNPNKYGAQMFERTTNKRFPLRLLFGPSLSQLAERAFNNGLAGKDKTVQAAIDNLELTIIDKVIP